VQESTYYSVLAAFEIDQWGPDIRNMGAALQVVKVILLKAAFDLLIVRIMRFKRIKNILILPKNGKQKISICCKNSTLKIIMQSH